MKIRFWGVRGSFPVASPDVIRYGGNTPCIEIETDDGTIVIDAGTGIRDLGKSLLERSVTRFDLLLSHAHWDHIQGFPHFEPLYRDDVAFTVHALRHPKHTLPSIFAGQQQEPFYPVPLQDMSARITSSSTRTATSSKSPARASCAIASTTPASPVASASSQAPGPSPTSATPISTANTCWPLTCLPIQTPNMPSGS